MPQWSRAVLFSRVNHFHLSGGSAINSNSVDLVQAVSLLVALVVVALVALAVEAALVVVADLVSDNG